MLLRSQEALEDDPSVGGANGRLNGATSMDVNTKSPVDRLLQPISTTIPPPLAMAPFARLPAGVQTEPTPFRVSTAKDKIHELHEILKVSKVGKATYENEQQERDYGVTREWLANAKTQWEVFDWQKIEDDISMFPNYTTKVEERGDTFDIHFVGLFSERADAVPLIMLHGWPGSFLEFLPILRLLKAKYTPQTLPYHVVVPSLPGYAYSSPPPLNRDFRLENCAAIMDSLMASLGFSNPGYIVQGGDVGSKVARVMGALYPRAKAIHVNFCIMPDPGNVPETALAEPEKKGLIRAADFHRLGSAYALEHATKPSTIGLVLAASPLALLAWIGEKFLAWTDEDPDLDTVLEAVTLYWVTECAATSLWPYRQLFTPGVVGAHENPAWHLHRPFGYSWFPREIAPVPRAWAATTGDLVFFRRHERGGHFAALERPGVLLRDVEEFVAQVWPTV
ncbi:Uu.00g064080.m01.CDS01 [Anthostomella pinea]|uniref:Uu.00g064080.m01.CDS01 n=1 Tax=Anthostomella pinea TaxID=933095 RepID=A0AAI8VUQ7_9PEZI|nr:Uu.00g064080.m01.CDS01 [Anthostomella pinea]